MMLNNLFTCCCVTVYVEKPITHGVICPSRPYYAQRGAGITTICRDRCGVVEPKIIEIELGGVWIA